MKKICVVTSTRADYGLLTGIASAFKNNPTVDFSFVATGTHLSEFYGNTVEEIVADGFNPVRIDIGIGGDRPTDVLKTMSRTLGKFSEYFSAYRPDLLVVLGDRFEIFSVAQAAVVHNIPIAHIHGGEVTEGAIDDAFRHSLTKMSSLHFTSTEQHKKRVIQLGEDPARVFNYGAPGLDNILNLKLLTKEELESSLGFKFGEKNVLVTFHPVTVSEEQTKKETKAFFDALDSLPVNTSFFVTMPNADTYSGFILPIIEDFKKRNPNKVFTFKSLGQLRYLSLMKISDVVAGNSSSGIIEAPFMNKAVVNVGDRQKGRTSSEHVIHVSGEQQEISQAMTKALSMEFQTRLSTFSSLYGDGKSSVRIADEVMRQDLTKLLPKKFYDITRK